MKLLSTSLSNSIALCPTATAHHPWCLHLAPEQQQEGGVCPHWLQRPALFTCQWADGQALREDQNSFPQSKSVLFLTKESKKSLFFLAGLVSKLWSQVRISSMCFCLWVCSQICESYEGNSSEMAKVMKTMNLGWDVCQFAGFLSKSAIDLSDSNNRNGLFLNSTTYKFQIKVFMGSRSLQRS